MGSIEDHSTTKGNCKTGLTPTGLLMEGLGHFTVFIAASSIAYQQKFILGIARVNIG